MIKFVIFYRLKFFGIINYLTGSSNLDFTVYPLVEREFELLGEGSIKGIIK